VGFYSAFIVADRVEVLTRKAGEPATSGVRWQSSAEGDFTVEAVDRSQRGTTVVLHLKEDAKEFADPGGCARWCAATQTTWHSPC